VPSHIGIEPVIERPGRADGGAPSRNAVSRYA